MNNELITRVVAELNERREREARSMVNVCIGNILQQQKIIKEADRIIEENQKALKQITTETITLTDILGTT